MYILRDFTLKKINKITDFPIFVKPDAFYIIYKDNIFEDAYNPFLIFDYNTHEIIGYRYNKEIFIKENSSCCNESFFELKLRGTGTYYEKNIDSYRIGILKEHLFIDTYIIKDEPLFFKDLSKIILNKEENIDLTKYLKKLSFKPIGLLGNM